jgi:signal transduction histidine kinase/uncharacterized protein HemY
MTVIFRLALCLLFSLFILPGFAQTAGIDSLRNAIAATSSEQEQADLCFQLAESLYPHDLEKGLQSAEQSLALATRTNYPKGKVQALTSLGTYFYYTGDNSKSRSYYKQAIAAVDDNTFSDYPAKTFIRLSVLLRLEGQYDSAQFYLDETSRLLQSQKPGALHASFYASSGVLANARSRSEQALVFLKKSLALRKSLPDLARLADTWRNIGAVYTDLSMYDSAEYCYRQVESLLKRVDDPEISTLLSLSRGETNFERGQLTAAIENYNDALDKLKINQYKRHYAYLLLKIGELYENQGSYHTAYEYFFNALKELEALKSLPYMARAYSQIGWCYNYQENFALAQENAKKSLAIAEQIGDSSSIAQNKNLLGYALLKTKKYQEALLNFQQALEIRKNIRHWWGVTYTLHNLALVYVELGQPKKALGLLNESLEMNKRIGNNSGFVFTSNALGLLYTNAGEYEKALIHLKQANEVARKIPLPPQLVANYKNYIQLYEATGDQTKTIRYFKLYTGLKDSLSSEISAGKIAKADALFQLQQKANEIFAINAESELQKERIKTQEAEIKLQQRVLVTVIVSLLILLVLLVVIFRLLRARTEAQKILVRQNKEIVEQKEEIAAQSEELTESNMKLAKLNDDLQEKNHEIETQAEKLLTSNITLEKAVAERTSQLNTAYSELETFFYRTSHDFRRPLTNYLGLAEIAKTVVKDKVALELFEKVSETTVALDSMLIKLQSISNIDYENQFQEFSVSEVITSCLEKQHEKIKQRSIKLITDCDDTKIKANEHLFRTILENLIENAVIFSTPIDPYIRINCTLSKINVIIIIEDNGQGISAAIQHKIFEMYYRGNDNSKGNGLGLYIAKRAIDKLGGNISFVSRLNEGSSFKITVPAIVL